MKGKIEEIKTNKWAKGNGKGYDIKIIRDEKGGVTTEKAVLALFICIIAFKMIPTIISVLNSLLFKN